MHEKSNARKRFSFSRAQRPLPARESGTHGSLKAGAPPIPTVKAALPACELHSSDVSCWVARARNRFATTTAGLSREKAVVMFKPFAVELYEQHRMGASVEELAAQTGISRERIEQRIRAAEEFLNDPVHLPQLESGISQF